MWTSKGFEWVASPVQNNLKDKPLYKVIDMQDDILRNYGMEVPYMQAWHSKEIARTTVYRSEAESHDLRFYCNVIEETNPSNLAEVVEEDDRFKRVFISFHACVKGFQYGCRPLLLLDGTHIYSKYKCILFGDTSKNENKGFFTVAYAVIKAEINDSWHWFLTNLRDALYNNKDPYDQVITFIQGRKKGLKTIIYEVFPESYHGYCLRHLKQNFNSMIAMIVTKK